MSPFHQSKKPRGGKPRKESTPQTSKESIFKGVNKSSNQESKIGSKFNEKIENFKKSTEEQKKERKEIEKQWNTYMESDEGKQKTGFAQNEIYKIMIPLLILIFIMQFLTGASNA